MFLVLFSFNIFSRLKKLFLFYVKFFFNINPFSAALGLCCFAQAFSSYREWGYASLWCTGFSWRLYFCRTQNPGVQALVVVTHGLRSRGSPALAHRLRSCVTRSWLLRSVWDLPGAGIEPVSPALAGKFFTTEPPGKFLCLKTLYFIFSDSL